MGDQMWIRGQDGCLGAAFAEMLSQWWPPVNDGTAHNPVSTVAKHNPSLGLKKPLKRSTHHVPNTEARPSGQTGTDESAAQIPGVPFLLVLLLG